MQRGIDAHALQHMGERQKSDAEIAFFIMVHLCGVDGRVIKIGVGNHGALGGACRSGCISNRRQIGRLHRPPDGFETGWIGFVKRPPLSQEGRQCDYIRRK